MLIEYVFVSVLMFHLRKRSRDFGEIWC